LYAEETLISRLMPDRQEPGPEKPAPAPKAGENRAQLVDRLFRENNPALIVFLTGRLRSESEARDVAQEAYLRLLQLERADVIVFHRAYLFRVAANLATDRLRQRATREKSSLRERVVEWLHEPTLPEQEAFDAADEQTLQQALGELPPRARAALTRHFLAGESIEAIAKSWNLTGRVVRYHLARALAHCRARLDEEA
jgi:RNA polymerase sigma-70 factor (ECF subfamily)